MTSPKKCCGARTNRWVIATAIAIVIVGAILSRVIEPGVRVEKVMLTANTPALRLSPATPGPHPIALLAHGATGSKENLFRFGEALAAAGFDCYSVDQAGHGESPQPCSFWHVDGKWGWATNILLKPRELERALGSVDVFIGHSMGSGAGGFPTPIFPSIRALSWFAATRCGPKSCRHKSSSSRRIRSAARQRAKERHSAGRRALSALVE